VPQAAQLPPLGAAAASNGTRRSRPSEPTDDGLTVSCARMHIADCRARIAAARTQQKASSGDAHAAATSAEGVRAEAHTRVESPDNASDEADRLANERRTVGTSMGASLATAPDPVVPVVPAAPLASPLAAIPATRQAPLGVHPAHAPQKRSNELQAGMPPSREIVQDSQRSKLSERLLSLRSLRDLWATGDVRKMLVHLRQLDDESVCVDLMRVGILNTGALDLECASLALHAIAPLLASREDSIQLVAVDAVSCLLLKFGPLISSNRSVVPDAVGVDLSAEARQQRCQACFERFADIRGRIDHLADGPVGIAAANLRERLKELGA